MRRNAVIAVHTLYWGIWVLRLLVGIALVGAAVAMSISLAGSGVPDVHVWLIAKMSDHPDSPLLNPVLMVLMVTGIALLFELLRRLGRVIGRVRKGDPFARKNPRDFYAAALLLFAIQIVGLVIAYLAPTQGACPHNGGFDGTGLLAALAALVLAEVFREGTRLRDDVAGTV